MHDKLFETALGVSAPWSVAEVRFDAPAKRLTIRIDFAAGSRFALAGAQGQHPVHDTVVKTYRHLNFFQHECQLEVRTPRVKLPDGQVRLVEAEFAGKLAGFTLLFEALVLLLAREMPFAAVGRMVGESWHRVRAICARYVDCAVRDLDLADVRALAIDETSCRRGHDYLSLAADAVKRRVVFVTAGREAETIQRLAADLKAHGGAPENIEQVSIDMSPAFILGVTAHLPNARITFDKYHVVAHASAAVDQMRRIEQKTDPTLKGMRWALLKDRSRLTDRQRGDLDTLVARLSTKRTARAWVYREQLREVLACKQINVVSAMLTQWCTNVMRSKVEPMKAVAKMIRAHFDGIVAWTQTRQTNGFLEAINGLFQAAKRRARGYGRYDTMRTVIFLIAGKLDFSKLNPHARQPT